MEGRDIKWTDNRNLRSAILWKKINQTSNGKRQKTDYKTALEMSRNTVKKGYISVICHHNLNFHCLKVSWCPPQQFIFYLKAAQWNPHAAESFTSLEVGFNGRTTFQRNFRRFMLKQLVQTVWEATCCETSSQFIPHLSFCLHFSNKQVLLQVNVNTAVEELLTKLC